MNDLQNENTIPLCKTICSFQVIPYLMIYLQTGFLYKRTTAVSYWHFSYIRNLATGHFCWFHNIPQVSAAATQLWFQTIKIFHNLMQQKSLQCVQFYFTIFFNGYINNFFEILIFSKRFSCSPELMPSFTPRSVELSTSFMPSVHKTYIALCSHPVA